MQITNQEARNMLRSIKNGTIYTVVYMKKDGTTRVLNTIKGTSQGVKGVGMSYDPSTKGLLPAYDLQLRRSSVAPDKAWRMVNLDSIVEIRVFKTKYVVK